MIENVTEITKDALVGYAQERLYSGYRFITATCVDNGDGTTDVFYHFDLNSQMTHALVKVVKDEALPSISGVFFGALLVENEMKELFGLNITNIILDFGGHMLLSDEQLAAPMARQITVVKKGAEQ